MPRWLFTSTLVNFAASPVTTTSQSSGASNQISAAAFDAANNLLFYYNTSSGSILSASNQSSGRLNGLVNPNKSGDELDWSITSKEMVVTPVPGKPYFYYLFYTLSGNYSSVVAYAIIDCSCGTPVIAQNSQRIDAASNAIYNGGNPGLAVTKQQADGTRKLYVAAGTSVISYVLNSGGGLGSRTLVTGAGANGTSCEAELSPDGKYLAWGASQVYICDISINTPPVLVYTTPPNTIPVSGLEFSGGSDKLFISGNGLNVYTLSTQAVASIATGSVTPATATQLELAYDGLIYGATSSGSLFTINPATQAVAASPIPISLTPTSLALSGMGGAYTFPDQIDSEDYSAVYYLSSAPLISRGLKVDGSLLKLAATSSPAPAATPVYTCNPLTLTSYAPSSPTVVSYDVVINRTDADGNVLATGYAATYTNVSLPLNLGALNNGYLANAANTGYYQVKLIGYDACQPRRSSEAIGRMQVSSLTAGSANFFFVVCSGAGPTAPATSPAQPALLPKYSGGGINISPSSGDYDSYQVQFAQYVAGSNPAQFTNIGLLSDVPKPTSNGTPPPTTFLSYLATQAGLEASYFLDGHPGSNVLHRLTLTVRNPCGTSPQVVGYFINSDMACRSVAGPAPAPDKPQLYPNPLTGTEAAHLRFMLPTAQPVRLELTDALTGQVRLTVLRDVFRQAGEQDVTIDTGKLPAGVYLYRLTTETGTVVGRVLKAD